MFKRIVAGVDGTDSGRDAAALGGVLSKATGAVISLVGVHSTSLFPIPDVSDRRTLRKHAEGMLRREREQYAPNAIVHTVVDYSIPRALRHHAESWSADLVVVGSEPTAAVGHVSIGRRARQLLYEAPFALAVAPRGLAEGDFQLRRIGVGFDGGPEAVAALGVAADLARAAHAELSVLSVVEDHVPALSAAWIARNRRHDLKELREVALAEAQEAVAGLELSAEVSAIIGDPGDALRELTEKVDLTVVGSRRWGPVARLVSGGVGETLVADASCAVVIVPRPRRSARSRQKQSE